MGGFWKDQDGGPNVEFCFFSLGEGSFKSRNARLAIPSQDL